MRDHITADVHAAFVVVDLHIPHAQSLKERRSVVTRAVAALKNTLGASVAEIAGQDAWQRCVLGVAICEPRPAAVTRAVEQITPLIEDDPRVTVLRVDAHIENYTYP